MPTNEELAQQLKAERAKNSELTKTLSEKEEAELRLTEQIANMEVPEIVNGVTSRGIKVMTPDEYAEMSAKQGRYMGRKLGTKTECSIEELRALINSHWTPKMVMDKHGIDEKELEQLVWRLSKAELRDNPIRYSVARDTFSREG